MTDQKHKPAAPQTGYSWTNSAPQGATELSSNPLQLEWESNGEAESEFGVYATRDACWYLNGAYMGKINGARKEAREAAQQHCDKLKGVLETILETHFYAFKATSEARIAALQAERDEDANQLDSARHTVDVLTARIAELEAEVAILVDGAYESAKVPKHDNRVLAVLARDKDLAMVDALATARNEALEEAAQIAYVVCANTRHVTLGDTAVKAIHALKTPEGDG